MRAFLLERNVHQEEHPNHGPRDGPSPALVQVAAPIVDAQLLVSRSSNACTRIDDIVVTREETKQGKEAHEEGNDDALVERSIDGEARDAGKEDTAHRTASRGHHLNAHIVRVVSL